MDDIILNLDKKVEKVNNDYKLLKTTLANIDIKYLESIFKLSTDLDKIIETLIDLKTDIFNNNFDKLELEHQRDIKERIIQNKINKIIKPLMISLYLKFN
tara:strand:- start:976 stop:1275 length:300 start_codon:yes stop_codon:yes gene_type:complete